MLSRCEIQKCTLPPPPVRSVNFEAVGTRIGYPACSPFKQPYLIVFEYHRKTFDFLANFTNFSYPANIWSRYGCDSFENVKEFQHIIMQSNIRKRDELDIIYIARLINVTEKLEANLSSSKAIINSLTNGNKQWKTNCEIEYQLYLNHIRALLPQGKSKDASKQPLAKQPKVVSTNSNIRHLIFKWAEKASA